MTSDGAERSATTGITTVRLRGGIANRGLVVRIGDTVRRPQTAASPAIHALLRHLEQVGFDGAPRYLGEDDEQREILSYVPGEAALEPLQSWALTDDALVSVAHLLRRYHKAVATFDPSPHAWATTVPGHLQSNLVSHNDPNLDNVVFRQGRAVALIDFDLASPGSHVWDVALAARLWVPLRAPQDVPDGRRNRVLQRLRIFVDAYALSELERAQLPQVAIETHDWCYAIVDAGAQQEQRGYLEYWTTSMQQRAQRGRLWLRANAGVLEQALGAADPARDER